VYSAKPSDDITFDPKKDKRSKKGRMGGGHRQSFRRFRARVHNATVKTAEATTRYEIKVLKRYAMAFLKTNPDTTRKYLDKILNFEKGMV